LHHYPLSCCHPYQSACSRRLWNFCFRLAL